MFEKISPTNLVQVIKPNYHLEISKKPLSAYHTSSSIWGSQSKRKFGCFIYFMSRKGVLASYGMHNYRRTFSPKQIFPEFYSFKEYDDSQL